MADTITSKPRWLKVNALADITMVVNILAHHPLVNTWNSAGLTDRHGRPLIMAGYRETPKSYTENLFGILFAGHQAENLRDQVLKELNTAYMSRHKKLPHVWEPKAKNLPG